MSNVTVKNFYGEIGGRNIYSFLAELDYDLKTSTERIEHLKKVLVTDTGHPHPFFEGLFEQTYDDSTKLNTSFIKLILNTTDGLYSDTNVCEVLTKLTDYVLFAEDMRALDKACKTEYKFYKDEVLFKRAQKELSIEGEVERQGACVDGETTIDDVVAKLQGTHEAGYDKFKGSDETIHILIKDTNFKKSTNQVIYAKDFDDAEIGDILKAYQHQINIMSDRLKYNKDRIPLLEAVLDTPNNGDMGFKILLDTAGVENKEEAQSVKIELVRENKMLIKHIGMMKCDMIDCKEQIKKPIRFKHLMSGTTELDFSNIDFIPKHKEDIVPWLRDKAKELEDYYSDMLDELEHRKSKNEQVLMKIHKYNKLYLEVQHMQTMSDDELYEEKYLNGIKDVIKQLILQPDKDHYDLQDQLDIEVYLAKEILASIKMDELDKLIISMLQQGLTQENVAYLLSKDFSDIVGESYTKMSVSKRLDDIIDRIMEFSENKLDNYLDTFRPADKVKVCSRCGRTLSREKFDKEEKGKFGLKSQCKECRSK